MHEVIYEIITNVVAVSKIRRVKVQGDGIRKGGEVEGDEGNRIKVKEGFYTFCQKDVAVIEISFLLLTDYYTMSFYILV